MHGIGRDIITKINFIPLIDNEFILEAWNSVKKSSSIKVEVLRKNKIINYEFQIKE